MRRTLGCIAFALFAAACGGDGKSPTGPNPPTPPPHVPPPVEQPGAAQPGRSFRVFAPGSDVLHMSQTMGSCEMVLAATADSIATITKTDTVFTKRPALGAIVNAAASNCEIVAYTLDANRIQLVNTRTWEGRGILVTGNSLDRIIRIEFRSQNVIEAFAANGWRQAWDVTTNQTLGSPMPNISGITGSSSWSRGILLAAGTRLVVLNTQGEIQQDIDRAFVNPRRAVYGCVAGYSDGVEFIATLDSLVQSFFLDPAHVSAPNYLNVSYWTPQRPRCAATTGTNSFSVITEPVSGGGSEVQFWRRNANPTAVLTTVVKHPCETTFVGRLNGSTIAYCPSTGTMASWKLTQSNQSAASMQMTNESRVFEIRDSQNRVIYRGHSKVERAAAL